MAERALDGVAPSYPIDLPGSFEDAQGRERIVISNDGHQLRTTVRGAELSGHELDDFEARGRVGERQVLVDPRRANEDATLTVSLPVAVAMDGVPAHATLHARIRIAPGLEEVLLTLALDGIAPVSSCGQHGWFDDELAEIADRLPERVRLLACWSCGLSDYSPLGHGLFGSLACFRDAKPAYRATSGTSDVLRLWPDRTEIVQETHLCVEWEARPPGRGYRG